jgi:hypothetical protein
MASYKQPELTFVATIISGEFEIGNVLCTALLPLKVTDSIELRFQFNSEQANIFYKAKFWKFSIKGEIRDNEKNVREIVQSDEVYVVSFKESNLTTEMRESTLSGSPLELTITQLLGYEGKPRTTQFNITPNALLTYGLKTHRVLMEKRLLGDEEIEWPKGRETIFALDEETRFIFTHVERNYKNDDGDSVSFNEPVVNLAEQTWTPESSIGARAKQLDDVLLIASFAAMDKTVCLGWESFDGHAYTKHYYRNRFVPTPKKKDAGWGEMIIDTQDFSEFIEVAYKRFVTYPEIDALRRAINFFVIRDRDTIEGGFMIQYSALEMLVLHFRRSTGLELIFDNPKQWKNVRKGLKTHIEQMDLPEEDEYKKALVKEKVSELNRISFATAYERFCSFYKVNTEDLWPVTNAQNGISLSQIRNKLVHGEHIQQSQYGAIVYAKENLKWTIGRMLLGIFGWDVNKSFYSPDSLRDNIGYRRWTDDRTVLSEKPT